MGKNSRPSFSSLVLFGIHLLQQFFDQSDPSMKGPLQDIESPRILRRLHTLRRWSHEQEIQPFLT
jgi:hypothetical protein